MSASRDKYRNPCAPPGYTNKLKPCLRLKDGLVKIDGVICQFILPMIEMDVFEMTGDFSKFVINSDSEDEEVEVVAVQQEEPIVIVLDDSEDSSEDAPIKEATLNDPSTEKIQVLSNNEHLSIKEKIIENAIVAKKSQNDERPCVISPVEEIEQITEKSKSSSICGGKYTAKRASTSETSSRRKILRNEQHEVCSRDDSVNSIPSGKNTQEITEENKSSSIPGKKSSPQRTSKHEASPKRKTSKKEQYEGYNSDSSAYSVYSKKMSVKEQGHSGSESDASEDTKINVKNKEVVNENLFGRYHCRYCNSTMNSLATFETHLSGKRHLKNIKLKNVVETVQKTIQPFQVESRYPPPPPGVCRTRVRESAYIQKIVESSIKTPCPGLNNIIEIRGISETTYYCELCSAPCSTASIISHLTGYRHLLRCLKHFDYHRYELIRDKKKFEVGPKLDRWLEDIERQHGRGRIAVEKEVSVKKEPSVSLSPRSERRRRDMMPGPSFRDPEDCFPVDYASTTIPDMSKSDFYCRICDSHMNNINMWEMHIRGKRHLANVKKAPGELPSKSKSVLLPNARALIMDEIDEVEEPVVGLTDMREVQNPEAPGELYNCFLCGACLTRRDVVEHVLSLKHRKKYLEKINHPDMATMNCMNILDSGMYSIIEEICANVEQEMGRGNMEVHLVKNAVTGGVKW